MAVCDNVSHRSLLTVKIRSIFVTSQEHPQYDGIVVRIVSKQLDAQSGMVVPHEVRYHFRRGHDDYTVTRLPLMPHPVRESPSQIRQ